MLAWNQGRLLVPNFGPLDCGNHSAKMIIFYEIGACCSIFLFITLQFFGFFRAVNYLSIKIYTQMLIGNVPVETIVIPRDVRSVFPLLNIICFTEFISTAPLLTAFPLPAN